MQEHCTVPSSSCRSVPSARELFFLFCRVGLTSFGGGTSGWLYREMVLQKRWIAEGEFLDVQALCQALPGVNVTNLAVWMGHRLLGPMGVASALAGIILLPSVLIVLIAVVFSRITHYPLTNIAMTGAVAAAIGLPFSMAVMMAVRVRRAAVPLLVCGATFALIGLFKVPLIWVALGCGGFSVIAEFIRQDTA